MKLRNLLLGFIFLILFAFAPFGSRAALNFANERTAIAEGWLFGQDEYWHLVPDGEKCVFEVGEKVQFFAQVGPINVDHRWKLKLYLGDQLYREITNDLSEVDPDFGWNYSNFVPFIDSLPLGVFTAEYYIDMGKGFEFLSSETFSVVVPQVTYKFDHAVTATDWTYGEGSEYWNLNPIGVKSEFQVGERIYLMTQIRNVYLRHRYKVELYREGTFLWDYSTEFMDVDSGWVYSNFYPYYDNARPGQYEFRVYLDTGDGFDRLETVPFKVNGVLSDYTYQHTYLAPSWEYGTGADYWNLKPVDMRDVYEEGERIYALAQVKDIYVNHFYKAELYRDGKMLWDYSTGVLEVGNGWTFSNFYPYYDNARPGLYEFKIYINTGSGYVLLDTKPFKVNGEIADYVYGHSIVAEGWTFGTSTEYWDLKPVNPGTEYAVGDNVYLLSQVRNIYVNHKWKVEVYKNDSLLWKYETPLNEVGSGWTYGNFTPVHYNAEAGDYKFKVYISTGSEYILLDTKAFTVR